MPYDHDILFDKIKPMFGTYTEENVDGLNGLIEYIETREWDKPDGLPYMRYWCSYVFATSYHETAFRMWPISEYGSDSYLQGKDYYPWYGRGHVQLTWQENYQRAQDNIVNRELLENGANLKDGTLCQMGQDAFKEQALDYEVSACVIFIGMQEGWFTGKKLTNYLTNEKKDYPNAREIVNPYDYDTFQSIADYAEKFEDAFDAAWIDEKPDTPQSPPEPDAPDKPAPPLDLELPPGKPELPKPQELKDVLDDWFEANPSVPRLVTTNPYHAK